MVPEYGSWKGHHYNPCIPYILSLEPKGRSPAVWQRLRVSLGKSTGSRCCINSNSKHLTPLGEIGILWALSSGDRPGFPPLKSKHTTIPEALHLAEALHCSRKLANGAKALDQSD